MCKIRPLLILAAFLAHSCVAQEVSETITDSLYDTYENYKEQSLSRRRIKHKDISALIDEYKRRSGFDVSKVGTSIEGRPLHLISLGSGETDVFLWSQMHGDEPTATQSIFDILNFFESNDFKEAKEQMQVNLRIHFLPMLNPDGAEVFQRRNTLGIDINRDALRLQSPEAQTLKRVRDSLEADFGFNLHDQSTYYNAERTHKPATISYLAPAFNYEKDVDEVRGNAMRIIGFMNQIIQRYAPGQVGRYNDDFEPRAFGDNIQKWGTSTVLIESGGYPGDVEKQYIRKLNYVSILSAIYAIATGAYKQVPLEEYQSIPENDRKLFDLKIEKLSYPLLGNTYLLDLGIHRLEIDRINHRDFWYKASVADQGDLSTFYGYNTLDATGYTAMGGKVYPETLRGIEEAMKLDHTDLLKKGYAYIRLSTLPPNLESSPIPLHLVPINFKVPAFDLHVGANPTFFLSKGGRLAYAVINGFLIDLSDGSGAFTNALIFR
jgi:hypothetical protein